jgi:hypothetical protein
MSRRHRSTTPPDVAAAYRAAGRNPEAVTIERMSGACTSPQETAFEIPAELFEACRQLRLPQDHARSLGLFAEDRDLKEHAGL